MALLTEELSISTVDEILNMDLTLPSYQRPYRWSEKSTNTLFVDTFHAYKNDLKEYRLGTVILHKENESTNYNIVDGQQRLTTLSILLYLLGEENHTLLEEKYSSLSNEAILRNHQILKRRLNELDGEKKAYKEYLLSNCTMVKIVTDEEQEAFQFFDSQNTRGKELAPHDLLKSYHLREMDSESESLKVQVINQWENIDTVDLESLFSTYLYPLTQWYKGKDGLYYSSSKIDSFKGIKGDNVYHYSLYHKASNLFVEQFNESGNRELLASNYLNQFQLTQSLIAGKRFFYYSLHYKNLLKEVKLAIDRYHENSERELPDERTGDKYIKSLYLGVALFFADRFGIDSLTSSVLSQLYTWSYSLRLAMHSVYIQTINKYAKGEHDRINEGISLFRAISEMKDPEELKLIIFDPLVINGNNDRKYNEIYNKLSE